MGREVREVKGLLEEEIETTIEEIVIMTEETETMTEPIVMKTKETQDIKIKIEYSNDYCYIYF